MKFISTRCISPSLNFSQVVLQGLADDGGLYVPEFLPQFDEQEILRMKKMSYSELFFEITKHFIDSEIDQKSYKKIINKSYQSFSHKAVAPLKQIDHNHFLLELFHGPTLAFKDFALQFLGNLLDYFLAKKSENIVIVGATSGDTGSAAIQGCMASRHVKIFILHPYQKVSEIQRKQMTTVIADNVFNLAIKGNFDDCQSMVKKMFAYQSENKDFLGGKKLVAVNSINFARIMAQIVYYFYAGIALGCSKKNPISFCVPTGNFGDIYAGYLAKMMGLSIKRLVIATNANDILARFLHENNYSKAQLAETISPSMNIQVSSNFERLLFDYHKQNGTEKTVPEVMKEFENRGSLKVTDEVLQNIRKCFDAYRVDDKETKATIKQVYDKTAEVIDPHTAVGVRAAQHFMSSSNYQHEMVVTLATAHPAKFGESLSGIKIPTPKLPNFLADLNKRSEKFEIIENDFETLKNFVSNNS